MKMTIMKTMTKSAATRGGATGLSLVAPLFVELYEPHPCGGSACTLMNPFAANASASARRTFRRPRFPG